jgi:cell division protein FtsB
MKKAGFFLYYLFIIAMLGAIGFVSYKTLQETQRKKQIEQEISALREEAEKVRKENQDILEKIAYFESPEFQEWEAKSKLNFQRPDENVVIVKPSPSQESNTEKNELINESVKPLEKIPNWKKWWNQYFK